MNTGYLDYLERLAKAATPGPWETNDGDIESPSGFIASLFSHGNRSRESEIADAEFIVALDPPTVLAIVVELREKILLDQMAPWVRRGYYAQAHSILDLLDEMRRARRDQEGV